MTDDNEPTAAMLQLQARIRPAVAGFMQLQAAERKDYTQSAFDAVAVLADEISELLAAIADDATRYRFQLEMLARFPAAIEESHQAALACHLSGLTRQ